jgi:hypothetical protein
MIKRSRFVLVCSAILAVSSIMVACDDDGNGSSPAGTQGASSQTPQSTLVPGVIEGNTFVSVSKGYRLTFPEGWTPDENFIDTPTYAIDAFIDPEVEGAVQPNMTVRCDYVGSQTTLGEFVEARRQVTEGFAVGDLTEEIATLAGVPAVRLEYEQRSGDIDLRKSDIYAIQGDCAWTITTTQAAEGDDVEAFEEMLASFQFTSAT